MVITQAIQPFCIPLFYDQLEMALQNNSSLRSFWPVITILDLEQSGLDKEEKDLLVRITHVKHYLSYVCEQNVDSIPMLGREIALAKLDRKRVVSQKFPKIDEEGVLGKGTYGIVTKVKLTLRKEVIYSAVKWYLSSDEKIKLENCATEYGFLNRCRHPNIIGLLYAQPGMILMELAEKTLSYVDLPSNLTHVFYDIARGLEYLHDRDLVHRDIKADNILIMQDGQAKIGDLGYMIDRNAFPLDGGFPESKYADFSRAGYMCPALRRKELVRKDAKMIDIWGIGYTILKCFFRKDLPIDPLYVDCAQPFVGFKKEVIQKALSRSVVQIHDPDLKITNLAYKCLGPDLKKTPTIQEVVEQLQALTLKDS